MLLALSACDAQGAEIEEKYRSLEVPTELLASDEARANGRSLYQDKCALCHGVDADGRGVRQSGLSGPPANFQSKEWRATATPRSVYAVISEGVQGTSMPAWPTLSERQRWELVAYLLSVAEEGP